MGKRAKIEPTAPPPVAHIAGVEPDADDDEDVLDGGHDTTEDPPTPPENPVEAVFNHEKPGATPEGWGSARPYQITDPDTAYRILAKGDSLHAVCEVLQISGDEFSAYYRQHKDFARAVDIGQQACAARWARLGQMGVRRGKDFNTQAYIHQMANRFKWSTPGSEDEKTMAGRMLTKADEIVAGANEEREARASAMARLMLDEIADRMLTTVRSSSGAPMIDIPPSDAAACDEPADPDLKQLPAAKALDGLSLMPDELMAMVRDGQERNA